MLSLNTEIDSGFYTVKFDSLLLKDAVVEADCIIPPLREDDALSSDSDADDVVYAKGAFKYVLSFNTYPGQYLTWENWKFYKKICPW